jgi:hypothetical protein
MSFFTLLYNEDLTLNEKGLRVKFYENICRQCHPNQCLTPMFVETFEKYLVNFLKRFLKPYTDFQDWKQEVARVMLQANSYDTKHISDIIGEFSSCFPRVKKISEEDDYEDIEMENKLFSKYPNFVMKSYAYLRDPKDFTWGEDTNNFSFEWFYYCIDFLPICDLNKHANSEIYKVHKRMKAWKDNHWENAKLGATTFVFQSLLDPYNINMTTYAKICFTTLIEYLFAECTELAGEYTHEQSWNDASDEEEEEEDVEELESTLKELEESDFCEEKPIFKGYEQKSKVMDKEVQREMDFLITQYNEKLEARHKDELNAWRRRKSSFEIFQEFKVEAMKERIIVQKRIQKQPLCKLEAKDRFSFDKTNDSIIVSSSQEIEHPMVRVDDIEEHPQTSFALEYVMESDKELNSYFC